METVSDLQKKEVINIKDGKRLGFVYDVEIDTTEGKIIAIKVPGMGKFLGLFGKNEDYSVPWEDIKKIGDDIILVDPKVS